MKKILLALFALAISPLYILTYTTVCHVAWRWLLEPQYGAGPTYASWFAIWTLATTTMSIVVRSQRARDPEEKAEKLDDAILRSITLWAMLGFMWLVGKCVGWL